MTPCAVLVVHSEPLIAEGLAAALSAFAGISAASSACSAQEAIELAQHVSAVVLDERLEDSRWLGAELRRRNVRVVVLGETGEDAGLRVTTRASVSALASALTPGARRRERMPGNLTVREQQILSLITRGLAGKQVAKHLGISPKTVEHHKTRIFSKLGVPNQTAAACLVLSSDPVTRNHRHSEILEAAP